MEDDMAGRGEYIGEVRTKCWSGYWEEDKSVMTYVNMGR